MLHQGISQDKRGFFLQMYYVYQMKAYTIWIIL